MRAIVFVALVALTAAPRAVGPSVQSAPSAQSAQRDAGPGLRGHVVVGDGSPVSAGAVILQIAMRRVTSAIQPTGEFRIVPDAAGAQQLFISAPGFAPHRVIVHVPPSRTIKLPPIQLSPASYFRVRLVTPAGEPVISARFQRQTLDARGDLILDAPEFAPEIKTDGDGVTIVGPLAIGRTLLAVDAPPLALMRLPEIDVGPDGASLDAGTIVMQRGAVLHVEVLDATGQPLPNHDVVLDDVAHPSALAARMSRTTADGRATFDRVAAGRYHLRAPMPRRCNGQTLSVTRVVSVPATGNVGTRLVLGGTLAMRLNSPSGVLGGVQVSATPDSGLPERPLQSRSAGPMRMRLPSPLAFESTCGGVTDADGRITLEHFPSGPARIAVRLPNSTHTRRVSVPETVREIPLSLPDGIVPVHVTNAATKLPLGNVAIRWTGSGARVEARTVASGDALLESTDGGAGTLEASAEGYETFTVKLPAPSADPYGVALVPSASTAVRARVVTPTGIAVRDAVVGIFPSDAREPGHVAVTDVKGEVEVSDIAAGKLRLTVTADGHAATQVELPADRRGDIMIVVVAAVAQ